MGGAPITFNIESFYYCRLKIYEYVVSTLNIVFTISYLIACAKISHSHFRTPQICMRHHTLLFRVRIRAMFDLGDCKAFALLNDLKHVARFFVCNRFPLDDVSFVTSFCFTIVGFCLSIFRFVTFLWQSCRKTAATSFLVSTGLKIKTSYFRS